MKNIKIILITTFLIVVCFIMIGNYKITTLKTQNIDQFETTDVALIIRFYKKFGIEISKNYTHGSHLSKLTNLDQKNFEFYSQDEKTTPKENDMIVWWTKNSIDGSPGHVGIIAEVEFNKTTNIGTVWTVEQGHGSTNLFSYELIRNSDDLYHIKGFDNLEVKGWNHPLREDLQVEPTYIN